MTIEKYGVNKSVLAMIQNSNISNLKLKYNLNKTIKYKKVLIFQTVYIVVNTSMCVKYFVEIPKRN